MKGGPLKLALKNIEIRKDSYKARIEVAQYHINNILRDFDLTKLWSPNQDYWHTNQMVAHYTNQIETLLNWIKEEDELKIQISLA